MKKILASIVTILIFLFSETLLAESLSGKYRCWQFNVGGSGGKCTSPTLTLHPNGHYTMGSEKGTFHVKNSRLVLSQSKTRGPGQVLEEGNQIFFEYEHKGLHHTVTYLRQGDAPDPAKKTGDSGIRKMDLTIVCTNSGTAVDWINTASLDCGDGNRYDALAYATDRQTLKAYFKLVPPKKTCSLSVSSGFDSRNIGSIKTLAPVKKTYRAPCAWGK